MKTLLLATAMVAAPVIAQTAPPTPPSEPTTDRAMTPTESAPAQPNQPAPGPAAAEAANAVAADQAAAAQIPAPPGPGPVIFQQPQTVDQAFPVPPPKASYPWCSKTVTDGCKQRVDPK